jgi:hypothetical protein
MRIIEEDREYRTDEQGISNDEVILVGEAFYSAVIYRTRREMFNKQFSMFNFQGREN